MQRFNGHLYWFSWQDNDGSVRNAKWDWFNARNYCRKRCMDLVSFETREEYEWVKGFINGELVPNTTDNPKNFLAVFSLQLSVQYINF